MTILEDAESFARIRNADIPFCKSIVFRLKSVGVSDEKILCAAYLQNSGSNFEEIFERFGREVAIIVASIAKDKSLPKAAQEEQYVKQLQNAPWESVLVKLCEISANMKFIKESEMSRTKRTKLLKQNMHHLNILRKQIIENRARTPGIEKLLDGVNETLLYFKQRPLSI